MSGLQELLVDNKSESDLSNSEVDSKRRSFGKGIFKAFAEDENASVVESKILLEEIANEEKSRPEIGKLEQSLW
jgi:hypothetical protein